ncbi:MAG: N-acetyltransferase [Clostridia bacterium]|nr:N-acetyltransferase [Clostridia bacterium]
MKKDIIIRPVKSEDAVQYTNLHNFVWRVAYKDIFPEEVFVDKESKTQQRIESFPQFARNDNTQMGYIAEVDGKIVGFVSGAITSFYPYFAERGFADLTGIYIHPDFQGKGIGSDFRKIFEKWASDNGATKYVIGVLKDNHNARKVYETWGGKLASHTQPLIKLGKEYEEVFYTFTLNHEQ